MKQPTTYKSNLTPSQVAKISAAIILLLVALCFAGCKTTDYCIANNPKSFYKEVNTKPFKAVNQNKCFKFKP